MPEPECYGSKLCHGKLGAGVEGDGPLTGAGRAGRTRRRAARLPAARPCRTGGWRRGRGICARASWPGAANTIGRLPSVEGTPFVDTWGPPVYGNTAFDEVGVPAAVGGASSGAALRQVVAPSTVVGTADLGINEAVDALVTHRYVGFRWRSRPAICSDDQPSRS